MLQTIMAFFGYVKVPKAVVTLSIAQELFLSKCHELESSQKGKECFARFLEGQKTITSFLRSGKLISG